MTDKPVALKFTMLIFLDASLKMNWHLKGNMLLRYIEVGILEIILEKQNSFKEHTTYCLNIALAGKYSLRGIIIFKTSMEPKHHYYNLMVECLHYCYNGEKFKSLTLDFF